MLTDLTVLNQWVRDYATERISYNIDLFNEATQGAIVLGTEVHPGDYFDNLSFAYLGGIVRQRDPRATGTIATKVLTNIIDTLVKVGAGTYALDLTPSQWRWIDQDPAKIIQLLGDMVSTQMMEQMINNAISAVAGAISNVGAAVTYSNGGTFANPLPLSFINLANASQLFGDRASQIRVWVANSLPANSLLINALTNAERLFTFNTVNVIRDAVGRVIVVSDTPALLLQAYNQAASQPAIYGTLGLTEGAVSIMQQNDLDSNVDTRNGNNNILRTWQAEWSYIVGVKGYAWDKATGGAAPSAAALATGSNWQKYVTSIKDTAGVLVKTNS